LNAGVEKKNQEILINIIQTNELVVNRSVSYNIW